MEEEMLTRMEYSLLPVQFTTLYLIADLLPVPVVAP